MESGPLSTKEFTEFGKRVVLFCHITTRIPGAKNDDLLGKVGGRGFPHLVFMSETGAVLKQQGARSVEAFNASMDELQGYYDLKKKAGTGDAAATTELFLKELEMGLVELEDAKKKLETMKLTDDQQKLADTALAAAKARACNADFQAVLQGIKSQDQVIPAGRKLRDMKKAGQWPADEQLVDSSWQLILQACEADGDAAGMEEAYNYLFGKYGTNPRAKPTFDKWKASLEALKAKEKEKKEGGSGDE
ncbi:MAG: hypothetical protein AB7K09_23865 [Planctomycetota bacterium]